MNNLEHTKRFIFTGTPGSGKTSVILALEKLGYVVVPESATDVIAEEQAKEWLKTLRDLVAANRHLL